MATKRKEGIVMQTGKFRRSYEARFHINDEIDERINPLHLIICKESAKLLTENIKYNTDELEEKNQDSEDAFTFNFICAIRVKKDLPTDHPRHGKPHAPTPSSDSSSQTSSSTSSSRPSLATSVVMSEDIIVCVWARDVNIPQRHALASCSSSFSIDDDSFNDTNNDIKTEEHSLVLQCTKRFTSHYNVDPSDSFYIRGIEMFPLSKAIFSVSNEEAYAWLQKDTFSQGLLSELCGHNILVRQNDILLAPYPKLFCEDVNFDPMWYFHIKAIACTPFQIGVMTDSIEIVIFFEKAITRLPADHRHLSGTHVDQYLDLQSSHHPQSSHHLQSFHHLQSSLNLTDATSEAKPSLKPGDILLYSALVIQQVIHWSKVLSHHNDSFENLDLTSVLGMPKKVMSIFGIDDGAVVKIILYPKELLEEVNVDDAKKYVKEGNLTGKLVKVHSLAKKLDETENVFISSMLLFNLQKSPPVNRSPLLIIEKPPLKHVESESDIDNPKIEHFWNTRIPVAKEMQFVIISSPSYASKASHEESLKKYFEIPRLLSIGDVFAVSSCDDPEFWQESKEDTNMRKPVIFFKVSTLLPRQLDVLAFWVDIHNTALKQVGSDHSYVPLGASKYLSYHDAVYGQSIVCPGLNKTVSQLEHFIFPFLRKRSGVSAYSELIPSVLLTGPRGCGKRTVVSTVARRLYMHIMEVNCHDLTGETSAVTETRIKNLFLTASKHSPCILLMRNMEVMGKERDGKSEDPRSVAALSKCVQQLNMQPQSFPIVVVATTSNLSSLAEDLLPCFLQEVHMQAPTEQERADIIQGLLESYVVSPDVSISHLAQRTAGFVLSDLTTLLIQTKCQAYKKVLNVCHPDGTPSLQKEEDIVTAGVVIEQSDLEAALDFMQSAHSDSIGAPKIPSVKWSDIGGLAEVKSDILDTIQLPLTHPELLAAGLRRSGVLLYGPPGTGKTLLAKAVATECSLNFLSVKGPELINMYVGQSEENVREVFKRARSATPCVIFFDELDSLAPNRGKSGDSGGVMDRVVSQLLAELDGLHQSLDVFVIGATNRPDLLDPALLRPGRFDKLLYLGVSKDKDSKMSILRALTSKFRLAANSDLESVAESCPDNLTGADLYALCADAMSCSIRRKIAAIEQGLADMDEPLEVTKQDFDEALQSLVPSVSSAELEKYEQIRASFG